MKPGWEAIIGLEVHVQLRTRTKMFCGCEQTVGEDPNTRTCPVCLGLPGALPTANAEAIRQGLVLGLALQGEIAPESTFYRKQYFYPDLPKGYQITQGPVPLVSNGFLEIPGDASVRGAATAIRVGIERAHLEEDAGKSSHEGRTDASLVDLNRAGLPLLEVVGRPDLRTPQEASDYVKALHHLVTYLDVSDGNMEEGRFRVDANVSVRRPGDPYGTRVEVKNLNSFRHLRQALDFEIERHIAQLESGVPVIQETRGWDSVAGETRSQRTKEEAMDYRFFPEPDLPVLKVPSALVASVKAALPELPGARIQRYQSDHGIPGAEARTLVQSRSFADFFEAVAQQSGQPRAAAAWMLGEVSRVLNDRGVQLQDLPLTTTALADLIRLVEEGTLALSTAKEVVFPAVLAGEGAPRQIVDARGLAQIQDDAALEALVRAVLDAHPTQVEQVRQGQAKVKGFLVGQILKAGQGKVPPQKVNALLEQCLS